MGHPKFLILSGKSRNAKKYKTQLMVPEFMETTCVRRSSSEGSGEVL